MTEENKALVRTQEKPGVEALRSLENLNWSKAIKVPAGAENKQLVRIFRRPAYIEIDHNIPIFNPDNILEEARFPPVYYAVYAFGVIPKEGGKKPEEMRFLRFPVASGHDVLGVEGEIFSELGQQTGQPVTKLKRELSIGKLRGIRNITGRSAPLIHEALRMIFKTQPCLERGIQGEIAKNYPHVNANLHSGWDNVDRKNSVHPDKNLVIVTKAHEQVYWYLDIGKDELMSNEVAGTFISPPITSDVASSATNAEIELLNQLVKNNS